MPLEKNTQENTTDDNPGLQKRRIKSFAIRQGRMSQRQRNAVEQHWSEYGVDWKPQPIDLDACFGRSAPVVLEIGFGMGASLAAMAKAAPEKNFLGIEVHKPGIGALLALSFEQDIHNIRVINHDAVDVLQSALLDKSLDRIQIYFPDPWHKSRHHKRRLIQPGFVQLLRSKLKLGGILHMATDWENYAEQMLEVVDHAEGYVNCAGKGHYSPRPEYRPFTKFEKRGERLGHGVWDLLYQKQDSIA